MPGSAFGIHAQLGYAKQQTSMTGPRVGDRQRQSFDIQAGNPYMLALQPIPRPETLDTPPSTAPRPWVVDCVMASRVLALLVSVLSLVFIGIFQASDIDTGGLFALYDTRTLPYNKCPGPGGAPPLFRDSIDAFVANVTGETCADFTDPRSPHGIVWRNLSAVYRYPITVRASTKRRSFWGLIFAYMRPLPVLWWVYVWSFVFQFYYVVQDWLRKDPILRGSGKMQRWLGLLPRWVRALCCCCCRYHIQQTHIEPARLFTFGEEQAPAGVCVYGTDCQHQSKALEASKYWSLLRQAKPAHGAAFLRWVEYACTSPLQLVFFALLMQNTTVDEAILLCNSQLLICLLGYAVEAELQAAFGHCRAHMQSEHWHAAEANMRQYRALFLHLCAWYVHGSVWAIIMGEFEDFNGSTRACIEGIDGAPAFVSAILYSQAVFFASFGIVQFVQLGALSRQTETRAAYAVDRIFWWAEAAYGALNVGSKFCIAVLLLANIPGMRSSRDGGGACMKPADAAKPTCTAKP